MRRPQSICFRAFLSQNFLLFCFVFLIALGMDTDFWNMLIPRKEKKKKRKPSKMIDRILNRVHHQWCNNLCSFHQGKLKVCTVCHMSSSDSLSLREWRAVWLITLQSVLIYQRVNDCCFRELKIPSPNSLHSRWLILRLDKWRWRTYSLSNALMKFAPSPASL